MDLKIVCEKLGWQGGTVHQAKAEIIRRVNHVFDENIDGYGKRVDLAIEIIRNCGVTDYSETNAILTKSRYGTEGPGTYTSLVLSCGK